MNQRRTLSALSLLALLGPLACADLIGLRPPIPEGDGSGGLGGDQGGDGGNGSGATTNSGGADATGGDGSGDGGGTNTGAASGDGGNEAGGAGSGGAGAGGGSGGEPPVPEPTLITSGAQEFWQIGEVTEGGTTADVSVDSAQTYQTWHGFGGAFNEQGWDALLELSAADRELALTLLFSKTEGAAFTWGRLPIGASSYSVDRYTSWDVESVPLSAFDIGRDEEALIPFVLAAQAIEPSIKFWASPWTPPPWMKTNNDYDGGEILSDANTLQQYADYFVAWIRAYEEAGIIIDHVYPQAEPSYELTVPSCTWGVRFPGGGTSFLGSFVEDFLLPTFDDEELSTQVWYGTLSETGTIPAYWNDLSTAGRDAVGGVGLQWAALDYLDEIRAAVPELLVMQTEHRGGNYPWLGVDEGDGSFSSSAASKEAANATNFWAPEAPNNYNYALETWGDLKAWISEPGDDGVNAYSAWNMVLDTGGFDLDEVRPWPQNALLVVDRATDELIPTPAYYVFRHLAQYVEVGAVRIEVQGGDGMAFENPDGSIVTILHNPDETPAPMTLSIDGTLVEFTVPERGWATINWNG